MNAAAEGLVVPGADQRGRRPGACDRSARTFVACGLTWGRLSLADHLAGLFASGPEIAGFGASRAASAALAGCAMTSKTPAGGMSSMSLMMARCCRTSGVSLRARSSRISGEPTASRYSPASPACRRLSMPGRCCGARDPRAPIQELSRAHVRRCRLAEARGGLPQCRDISHSCRPGNLPACNAGQLPSRPGRAARHAGRAGRLTAENRTAGRGHHALALGTWSLSGSRRTWTARSAIMTGPLGRAGHAPHGPGVRSSRSLPGRAGLSRPPDSRRAARFTPAARSVTGWPKASGERAPAAVTGDAASTTERSRWRGAL